MTDNNLYKTHVERVGDVLVAENSYVRIEITPMLGIDPEETEAILANWDNSNELREVMHSIAAHAGVVIPLSGTPGALSEIRRLHQELAEQTYALCEAHAATDLGVVSEDEDDEGGWAV